MELPSLLIIAEGDKLNLPPIACIMRTAILKYTTNANGARSVIEIYILATLMLTFSLNC